MEEGRGGEESVWEEREETWKDPAVDQVCIGQIKNENEK